MSDETPQPVQPTPLCRMLVARINAERQQHIQQAAQADAEAQGLDPSRYIFDADNVVWIPRGEPEAEGEGS